MKKPGFRTQRPRRASMTWWRVPIRCSPGLNNYCRRRQHRWTGMHRSLFAGARRRRRRAGTIYQVHRIDLRDLQGIDEQKERVERNTRQFVDGFPANNVLLTGARGTGKSSLIKALLNKYAPRGLRLIEVEKRDLTDLPDIVELIHARPEHYILYCDDLSFEADEPGYKALKVVLDGSVAAASENA